MSKQRSGFARRRLRAGVALVLCSAALVLPGCFAAAYDSYVITTDHPGVLYTIKKSWSDQIVWAWAGPTCNQDVSRDGTVGSRYDRALCTFFIIRAHACNDMSGGAHNICYSATEPNQSSDFNDAVDQQLGADDCLALHINPFADYNWTARRLGTGGCQR
jgi:hypothetical protein